MPRPFRSGTYSDREGGKPWLCAGIKPVRNIACSLPIRHFGQMSTLAVRYAEEACQNNAPTGTNEAVTSRL